MHRADAFTPYNLTLARARAQHVPAARDRQNRNSADLEVEERREWHCCCASSLSNE